MKKWKKTHRQRKRERMSTFKILLNNEELKGLQILCKKYNLSKKKMIIRLIIQIVNYYTERLKI
jgi:hypothetical protein